MHFYFEPAMQYKCSLPPLMGQHGTVEKTIDKNGRFIATVLIKCGNMYHKATKAQAMMAL